MDPSPKRKPPRATLEQKIRILDHYHQSGCAQSETVERYKSEVAISTSTFNEWIKREDDYRARYADVDSQFEKHARRKITYKYDKINRAMDLLVQQRMESGEEISEPVLRNYWQIYAHQFGVDNPKRLTGFSHGWLSQFKKRHGLSKPKGAKSVNVGASGDVTSTNNEKLLVRPHDPQEPQHQMQTQQIQQIQQQHQNPQNPQKLHMDSLATSPSESAGSGHFRPQKTLSFPQSLSYLSPGSQHSNGSQGSVGQGSSVDQVGPTDLQIGQIDDVNEMSEMNEMDTPESLESAMQLSLATRSRTTARDIERFFAEIGDRFFLDHQYDYPQTLQFYEDFKSSFQSERLITLRSSKEHVNVNVNVGANEKLGPESRQELRPNLAGPRRILPQDQVSVSLGSSGPSSTSVLSGNDASGDAHVPQMFQDQELRQLQTRKRRDMGVVGNGSGHQSHQNLANIQNQQNLETLQNLNIASQGLQSFDNQNLQNLRSRQHSRSGPNLLAMQRMRSSSRNRVSHLGKASQLGQMGPQLGGSAGSNLDLMGASNESSHSSSSPEDQAGNLTSQQHQQQQQYQYRRNSHHALNQGQSQSQSRSHSQGHQNHQGHQGHQGHQSHGHQGHQSHGHQGHQIHQSHQGHQSHGHQNHQTHSNHQILNSDGDQNLQTLAHIERAPVHSTQRQHGYRSDEGAVLDVDVGEPAIDDLFLSQARQGIQGIQGGQGRQGRQERQLNRDTYTDETSWSNSESRKLWEQNKLMLS